MTKSCTDSKFVLISYNELSKLHFYMAKKNPPGSARREHLQTAIRYCKEVIRIGRKVYGPDNAEETSISNINLSLSMKLLNEE